VELAVFQGLLRMGLACQGFGARVIKPAKSAIGKHQRPVRFEPGDQLGLVLDHRPIFFSLSATASSARSRSMAAVAKIKLLTAKMPI